MIKRVKTSSNKLFLIISLSIAICLILSSFNPSIVAQGEVEEAESIYLFEGEVDYDDQSKPLISAKRLLYNFAFSIVIGIIALVIMTRNSSGKVTTHDKTYLDPSSSRVVSKRDTYIRTKTSKVRKPTETSSSSGGRSSGGGRRSSGGRGF